MTEINSVDVHLYTCAKPPGPPISTPKGTAQCHRRHKDETYMLFMSTCSCEHIYMHTSQHTIELWVHALVKVLGLIFTVSFIFWAQVYYGFLFSAC